jgi:hypothetical protein
MLRVGEDGTSRVININRSDAALPLPVTMNE